jgi:hypothetical protein
MLLKLERVLKASSFLHFFESHVHEVLIRDKHFQIRSLEGLPALEFAVTSDSQIEYIERKSYVDYAAQHLHEFPLASNHHLCDNWLVDERRRLVIFFQVTSSYHHPVSYKGLEDVLLKLSSVDWDMLDHEKILLFVVPDTMKEIISTRFRKQIIEGSEALALHYSKRDLLFKEFLEQP